MLSLNNHAHIVQKPSEPLLAGNSAAAHALRQMVSISASSDQPLMITGLDHIILRTVAKAVHKQSIYATNPFIEVDCNQLESDHFAVRWEGTLFLHDISMMNVKCQLALFDWLSSNNSLNVRIIASSYHPLRILKKEDQLIQPLIKMFSAVEIPCVTLTLRKEDIPAMLEQLWDLDKLNAPPVLDKMAGDKLMQFVWTHGFTELLAFASEASLRYGGTIISADQIDALLYNKPTFRSRECSHKQQSIK